MLAWLSPPAGVAVPVPGAVAGVKIGEGEAMIWAGASQKCPGGGATVGGSAEGHAMGVSFGGSGGGCWGGDTAAGGAGCT